MSNIETDELIEQHDALGAYLGSLLDVVKVEGIPEQKKAVSQHLSESVSDGFDESHQDAEAGVVDNIAMPPEPCLENIMTFKVSGMLLGIPLKVFAGVQTLVDEPTLKSPAADWYLGNCGEAGASIHIVDTYRMVVPEQRQAREYLDKPLYGRSLILINQGTIGFLCDQTQQVINLGEEQVIMSSEHTSRAWLMGMVKSRGIAILNTARISSWLDEMSIDHKDNTGR